MHTYIRTSRLCQYLHIKLHDHVTAHLSETHAMITIGMHEMTDNSRNTSWKAMHACCGLIRVGMNNHGIGSWLLVSMPATAATYRKDRDCQSPTFFHLMDLIIIPSAQIS